MAITATSTSDLTLDRGVIGETYRVVSMDGLPESTARRLESVGMTAGTHVTVLNNKSRGTVVARVRETRWALGRTITSAIEISRDLGDVPVVNDLEGPPLVPAGAGSVIAVPGIGVAVTDTVAEEGEGR